MLAGSFELEETYDETIGRKGKEKNWSMRFCTEKNLAEKTRSRGGSPVKISVKGVFKYQWGTVSRHRKGGLLSEGLSGKEETCVKN